MRRAIGSFICGVVIFLAGGAGSIFVLEYLKIINFKSLISKAVVVFIIKFILTLLLAGGVLCIVIKSLLPLRDPPKGKKSFIHGMFFRALVAELIAGTILQ